ncbi:16004_t:CDS:2, partial [Racocetra persica]
QPSRSQMPLSEISPIITMFLTVTGAQLSDECSGNMGCYPNELEIDKNLALYHNIHAEEKHEEFTNLH